MNLSINEQKKYEIIKSLADLPDTANKDRAALILGCTKRHINRMLHHMNGCRGRYGTYIWLLMMPQALLQVLGLTHRKLLTDTTMYLSRYLLIMVFIISFLLINELYLLTRKKVPYRMTKTPTLSSPTPVSNLAYSLNQVMYHKLKDA